MDAAATVLVGAGLVAGIVEAIKRGLGPGFNSDRWGALLALAVGVASGLAGVFLGWYELPYGQAVLAGLTAGLTASGLYRWVQGSAEARPPRAPVARE